MILEDPGSEVEIRNEAALLKKFPGEDQETGWRPGTQAQIKWVYKPG